MIFRCFDEGKSSLLNRSVRTFDPQVDQLSFVLECGRVSWQVCLGRGLGLEARGLSLSLKTSGLVLGLAVAARTRTGQPKGRRLPCFFR